MAGGLAILRRESNWLVRGQTKKKREGRGAERGMRCLERGSNPYLLHQKIGGSTQTILPIAASLLLRFAGPHPKWRCA